MNQPALQFSSEANQSKPDDFALIHGIGPAVAKRLHNAKIFRFEQLARMTPDEIAEIMQDMIGFSLDRIVEQDWIGQAQEFATKSQNHSQDDDLSDEQNKQREESFIVRLKINADNNIRQTIVMSVKDEENPGSWPGYDEQRLHDFFIDRACLQKNEDSEESLSTSQELLTKTALTTQTSVEAVTEKRILNLVEKVGEIHLEPHYAGSIVSKGMIPVNQPFNMRIGLDLNQVNLPSGDSPLNYSVTIYAKKIGGGERQVLGTSQGTFMPADNVVIDVGAQRLSSGTYKMDAIVTFSTPDMKNTTGDYPIAMVESATFHVY